MDATQQKGSVKQLRGRTRKRVPVGTKLSEAESASLPWRGVFAAVRSAKPRALGLWLSMMSGMSGVCGRAVMNQIGLLSGRWTRALTVEGRRHSGSRLGDEKASPSK